jgi:hypothetical protein
MLWMASPSSVTGPPVGFERVPLELGAEPEHVVVEAGEQRLPESEPAGAVVTLGRIGLRQDLGRGESQQVAQLLGDEAEAAAAHRHRVEELCQPDA